VEEFARKKQITEAEADLRALVLIVEVLEGL